MERLITNSTNISRIKFKNTYTMYENFIKCTVKDYEYNLSYNPTLLSGSQSTLVPWYICDGLEPFLVTDETYLKYLEAVTNISNCDVIYTLPPESNFGILKDFAQGKGSILYDIETSYGTIIDGGTNIGNQGDDVVTSNIPIGFDFTFYDKVYSTVNLSSNGNLQFETTDTNFNSSDFPIGSFVSTIFALFGDLTLNSSYRPDAGIYVQTIGNIGNRIFCTEWRGVSTMAGCTN